MLQVIAVFISQILFLFLRTLNVKAISEGKTAKVIVTGLGVGCFWLIATSVGVYSIHEIFEDYTKIQNWIAVAAHLSGGALGSFMAMKNSKQTEK